MRLDYSTAIAGIALVIGAPAAAQEISPSMSESERWEGGLDLSLSPRFGKSLPFRADDDPIDESEGDVSVRASRKGASGLTNLQLKAGVVTSPQLLDDTDATSAIYGQIQIGDSFIPYHRLAAELRSPAAQAQPDQWRPYGRYRVARNNRNFFDGYSRTDHQLTAGIRFRDIRAIMANSLERNADGSYKATTGWYYEARAELTQILSTDDTRTRFSPLARLDIYSRPLIGSMRVFARIQGDLTYYDNLRAANLDKRVDRRVRLTAGLDLSGLFAQLTPALTGELAGQYQRRWSNDPNAEHERGYFVPTITLATTF